MDESATVALRRILHPCVLIEGGGARLLVDPCFGTFARRPFTRRVTGIVMPEPGIEPEKLDDLALIAMTHAHEDHFDVGALARIPSKGARVIVPTPGQARRVRRLGFGDVIVLPEWESAEGAGWRITAVPARAPNARVEISYVLRLGGLAILHAGDTAMHDRFEEIRERCAPDVGCLPVSGVSLLGRRLTMTPEEAARAAALLELDVAIPIHAEMGFGRISSILYRAPGTEAAFAAAARRLAPRTRVLLAPRGARVPLSPRLDEPEGYGYPDGR